MTVKEKAHFVFKRRYLIGAIVVLAACVALPPVLMHAQQPRQGAMTLEALAAKVKHLEDIQEITNVLVAYGRALDSRDFKAYSALFAKDGSWSGGMGTVSGGCRRSRLHDQPDRRRRPRTWRRQRKRGGGAGTMRTPARTPGGGGGAVPHIIMSNFKIDVNGDTATAISDGPSSARRAAPGISWPVRGRARPRGRRLEVQIAQAFNDVTAPTAATAGGGQSRPPRCLRRRTWIALARPPRCHRRRDVRWRSRRRRVSC
jgi:hypothetical protein